MTRKELRAGHVALWEWLAETGEEEKLDWPGWDWNGGAYQAVRHGCFACAAVMLDHPDVHPGKPFRRCASLCPIAWDGGKSCGNRWSEFFAWLESDNEEGRRRLAAKIASLWPEEE